MGKTYAGDRMIIKQECYDSETGSKVKIETDFFAGIKNPVVCLSDEADSRAYILIGLESLEALTRCMRTSVNEIADSVKEQSGG